MRSLARAVNSASGATAKWAAYQRLQGNDPDGNNDPSREDADQSWLSGLAFWSNDDVDKVSRYQVRVAAGTDQTIVTVADEQGQPDDSRTALRILTLLQEQVR